MFLQQLKQSSAPDCVLKPNDDRIPDKEEGIPAVSWTIATWWNARISYKVVFGREEHN